MSHVPSAAFWEQAKWESTRALPWWWWWWWCSLWPFPSSSHGKHSPFSHTEILHSALWQHNSGDPTRVVPLRVLSRVCFVLLCTLGLLLCPCASFHHCTLLPFRYAYVPLCWLMMLMPPGDGFRLGRVSAATELHWLKIQTKVVPVKKRQLRGECMQQRLAQFTSRRQHLTLVSVSPFNIRQQPATIATIAKIIALYLTTN